MYPGNKVESKSQSKDHTSALRIKNTSERDPVGVSEFFLGFICNCLSYFTTAKISFTSILNIHSTDSIEIIPVTEGTNAE